MGSIEESGDRGAVAPAGARQGPLTPLTPGAPPNGEVAGTATPAGAAGDTTAGTAPLARLRGFHPGWFGAVMGTAIVGVAASLNPGQIASLAPAARTLSQVMAVLAAALAVVLAVPYLGRFALHRDAALADLRDPVAGALYGTLPGGHPRARRGSRRGRADVVRRLDSPRARRQPGLGRASRSRS